MPPLIVPRRPTILALLAALAALSCSSAKDVGGQKAYGAEMARRGFWREALFRFEKAAAASPDDSEIQNNLAVAYESLGETANALAAYKRALALAPNDAQIKRNYARFAEYYTSAQRASSPGTVP